MSNQQQQQQQQQSGGNRRSLNGLVTKLVSDGAYGFINDEIFFPQTNVVGGPVGIGDQVYAECEYSANLPIKWNANAVKVLQKANPSVAGSAQPSSEPMLRQTSQQQDVMNQQQPRPFADQSQPVAVTYQQHRQQRNQRQFMDKQQSQPGQQQNLDQSQDRSFRGVQVDNFYGGEKKGENTFNQQQQQQQPDTNIQPFQTQSPMGPPNFAFTSQLGSAFVQGHQFQQAPFISHQPSPMVEQQQHLLPNYPMLNQRNNHQNKGMSGPSRFNNQGDKNDRQNNRRNLNNRNDNKFDPRNRGMEQDQSNNSSNSNNNTGNGPGTGRKGRNSRDRSTGRGSRRGSPPARTSPAPNSSARSTTSVGSDRGIKSRRHYEVLNLPKTHIMTNINSANMKQRCPSSIHVPSDLKEVIVNRHFRLDLKNTPKPLKYSFEKPRSEECVKEVSSNETEKVEPNADEPDKIVDLNEAQTSEGTGLDDAAKSLKPQQQTPPSSKSDIKLNHKYGVKVILISLPEMDSIYKEVFGQDFNSYSNGSDVKHLSKLDETISLLCNKGSNNGNSLIGGKFDPLVDGFVDGVQNRFERHGRHPNLVSTCKRVVLEQTGLDLGECQSWTLVSTFIYNNKSDYFSTKASIEYSFVYMPQIWTMYKDIFDQTILEPPNKEDCNPKENMNTQSVSHDNELNSETEVKETKLEIEKAVLENESEKKVEIEETIGVKQPEVEEEKPVPQPAQALDPDCLSELKVADLKVELDKRNIKYKGLPKKAELVAMLRESILSGKEEEIVNDSQVESQSENQVNQEKQVSDDLTDDTARTEAIHEVADDTEADKEADMSGVELQDEAASEAKDSIQEEPKEVTKRKLPEDESADEQQVLSKKPCLEEEIEEMSPTKEKRVELIKKPFIVYMQTEQSPLSLVSLHEAAQAGRHDQFELSVASSILKESLTQHLSEYILTALIEDHRSRSKTTATSNLDGSFSASSSQETTSDTNNNLNNSSKASVSSKNPPADQKEPARSKEFPVDRYLNLAMSYFDASHMGYIQFEDLTKLFNNTGLTISKRALLSIIGESERLNYKTLPDLSPKLPPTYLYEFPDHFKKLPGQADSLADAVSINQQTVEYKGVSYDIEKLIQQVKEAETLRVNMVDRFNYAIENSDKQAEEIHVLEVSQKSLARAIKAQNDEICDLKRERDMIKKKYEALRKGINESISSLTDLAKEEK